MGQLVKLSREKVGSNGHSHVAYIGDDGRGVTSIDAGHQHEVMFDPLTGGLVVGVHVGKEGEVGHMHQVVPVGWKQEPKEDANEVVGDVYTLANEWYEAEEESFIDAARAEKFLWGEQWETAHKSELEQQGRSALTINLIERQLDQLCGEERADRTEFRYLPTEAGDQRKADIFNYTAKVIREKCCYSREKSKAFEDTAALGRGALNAYVDDTKSIEPDIKIERFPWDGVIIAPHDKEDLEDCDGLIKYRMYSRAKLKQLFPNKGKEIDDIFTTEILGQNSSMPVEMASHTYFKPGYLSTMRINGRSLIDAARKEVMLIECWRRMHTQVSVAVDPNTGYVERLDGWSSSDVAKVKTLMNVVERPVSRMRITKVAGSVLLSDQNPAELPIDDFFIIPIYAKKRGARWKGKVLAAMDLQREVNKRHSQAIDIGNQAGYGWFYDDMTFSDKRQEKNFEENSAAPNFKIKVTDQNKPPVRMEGLKFPSEIVQLMQMSDAMLVNTMNIEVQSGGANESAGKFMERKKAKLYGSEYLFDNLAFAEKKLGRIVLKMIQTYYRPERIARILGNVVSAQGAENVMIGGRPADSYTQEEIIAILEAPDVGEYDIDVGESSYSPTARMATFMMLSDMARGGMPIPPELIIEFMDVPDALKQKIQQSLMAQQQAQADAASQTAKMEINKSLIGKGIIPPEVQADLEAQQQQGQQQAPQVQPPQDPLGASSNQLL